MKATAETFAEHYLPARGKCRSPLLPDTHIEVLWSSTLDADVAKWRRAGYTRIGQADTLSKAADQGPTRELAELARSVGADLVLFCIWPAKLKAVKRTAEGEIDLWAALDNPPASFSPKSYAVTRAVFMAKAAT